MVEAQPDLQVSAKSPINLGESVFLTAEGADAYNWFPPGPLQQSSGNRVLAQPLATTVFTVVAENAAGCISTNTLAIEVIADYQLEIFNVLSLSENKLNDYFYISNISAYPDNNVKVFDQWNHLVFEQDNYQNNWNGRNANAELLAPGTYYYHISFKNSNKRYTGALLIINE